MNPKRLTPSMSLLLAFEAAARHCSFTKAADELALTQSAVSRQVQALEASLQVALFKRDGRHIELTGAGALYQQELAGALARICSATLQVISRKAEGDVLHLGVLPTFASKWLMPHMPAFYAQHPDSLVHIHSRIFPVDLSRDTQDMTAVICAGSGDWPGFVAHRLLAEKMVAVASPTALPDYGKMRPAHWSQQLLLNVVSRPHAWPEYFERIGLRAGEQLRNGPSFELTAHLIQAVVAGIGIALVPSILVQEELSSGALVALHPPTDSGRGYYLAYPTPYQDLPALRVFRAWLLGHSFAEA